jgi:three-Cys-motif partner protein
MSEPIEDDGLITPEVGRWSKQKYHFLQRYLHLFATGMKNKWPERHYVDLFAGAGVSRIRDTSELVMGSPLLAATVRDAFTHLHLCERDEAKASALDKRLRSRGLRSGQYTIIRGDANDHVKYILEGIPAKGALSVVFADPYGLHLDFSTVQCVAAVQADLIVLLADNMDALRNWATYYLDNQDSPLDRFMGEEGWREELQAAQGGQLATRLRDRYKEQLRTLGYRHFGYERVSNTTGRDIYSLVYASRHRTGLQFWEKARKVDEGGQRQLPFGP